MGVGTRAEAVGKWAGAAPVGGKRCRQSGRCLRAGPPPPDSPTRPHRTAGLERARRAGGEHVTPLADSSPAGNRSASRQTGGAVGGRELSWCSGPGLGLRSPTRVRRSRPARGSHVLENMRLSCRPQANARPPHRAGQRLPGRAKGQLGKPLLPGVCVSPDP